MPHNVNLKNEPTNKMIIYLYFEQTLLFFPAHILGFWSSKPLKLWYRSENNISKLTFHTQMEYGYKICTTNVFEDPVFLL